MSYRVFTAAETPQKQSSRNPQDEPREFRRLRDALERARAPGEGVRAVLVIDEHRPAKVTVRSREDAARTTP